MAEAIGIAGSIAGLAALAGKIAADTKTVCDGYKDARNDCQYILNGSRDLANIVAELETYIKTVTPSNAGSFFADDEETRFREVIDDCTATMTALGTFMESYKDVGKKRLKRFMWGRFGQNDHKKYAFEIERLKLTILTKLTLTK